MNENKTASRGTQMQRVYAYRLEILDMLQHRVLLKEIRSNLGLDDMPMSTFGYLCRILKAEYGINHHQRNRSVAANGNETSSLGNSSFGGINETEQLQPMDASSDVDDPADDPRKPARRKRRKKGIITPNLDYKDPNLDPSKWSGKL